MNNNDINATLFELQQNLKNLSSVKDQVNFFQEKSHEITSGISEVQRKYVEHLQSVKSDYESRVNDLKNELTSFLVKTEDVNIQTIQKIVAKSEATIGEGIEKFETVSKKVESSNNEKIEAISGLLEQYKKIVEAGNSLIDRLEAIDFPTKIDVLSSKSQLIIESITSANQALEIKMIENKDLIINKIDNQNKEIKLLRTILFIICGFLILQIALKFIY
jgi:DNA uptake protein ComE-like DNA-binding protein